MPAAAKKNIRHDVNPVIICTGFHRSATSLVAQILHSGGLHMGNRLIGSHLSNPDGHFEDVELVTLNDALLRQNGTDWRFHDEVPLSCNEQGLASLQAYIARRDATHRKTGWGVKDPRVSLFLPEWAQLLGDRGRYVLVIRHWAASMQSLLNRHSRIVVEHGLAVSGDREIHRSFWTQPGLAARMWIAYCSRVLDFAQRQPDRVLMLPQPLLMNGFEPNGWINEHWGTDLAAPPEGVIKPELLNDQLDDRLLNLVTPALRGTLNRLWDQLLKIASKQLKFHLSDPQLEVKWYKGEEPLLQRACRKVEQYCAREAGDLPGESPAVQSSQNDTFTLNNFADQMQRCRQTDPVALARVVNWIRDQAPDAEAIWQAYGNFALRQGMYETAEHAFLQAVAVAPRQALSWFKLGQVYERVGRYGRAEVHYQQALSLDADKPGWLLALAALKAAHGDFEAAVSLLDRDIESRARPSIVRMWVGFMMELGRHEAAAERVKALAELHADQAPTWNHLLALLALPANAREARSQMNGRLRDEVQVTDLPAVLAQTVGTVDSPAAFRDLTWRMLKQWKEIYPEAEVRRVFS